MPKENGEGKLIRVVEADRQISEAASVGIALVRDPGTKIRLLCQSKQLVVKVQIKRLQRNIALSSRRRALSQQSGGPLYQIAHQAGV